MPWKIKKKENEVRFNGFNQYSYDLERTLLIRIFLFNIQILQYKNNTKIKIARKHYPNPYKNITQIKIQRWTLKNFQIS